MSVEFFEKSRHSKPYAGLKDVKVSYVKRGGGKMQSNIHFRNGAWSLISKIDRISFGIAGERMYFKSDPNAYTVILLRHTARISTWAYDLKEFVGEYDLRYDVKEGLYYIEREE